MIDNILAKYPDDVKLVIKNYPLSFHKQAKKVAKYALAAHKQGKYKEMYHKIMQNYKKLKTNEDLPLEYAKELGLDMNQFIKDFESPEIANQIELEIIELKTILPNAGVPKFFIQGKEFQGKRTIERFSEIIEKELKKLN